VAEGYGKVDATKLLSDGMLRFMFGVIVLVGLAEPLGLRLLVNEVTNSD
jgi:hypothetical protein